MLALGAISVVATAQQGMEESACVATLTPAEAASGSSTVKIVARLSTQIGDVREVKADPQSGVKIGNVAADRSSPGAVNLNADLSTAKQGLWNLTFVGSRGTCDGKLTVKQQ